MNTYKYFAFISYSRKDSKAAAWLQKRLEWFRFPVKLVPEERRPPHNRYVVPVILSGSVTSSGEGAALCPCLRELGEGLTSRNLPTMVGDADTAERDAWESGFVALSSYLQQLERSAIGDHIQRESRKQARTLRLWLGAVIALGLLAVLAGGYAWQQNRQARSWDNHSLLSPFYKNTTAFYVKTNAFQVKTSAFHEKTSAFYKKSSAFHEKTITFHEKTSEFHEKTITFYKKTIAFNKKTNAFQTS